MESTGVVAERVSRGEVDRDGVRREVDATAASFCAVPATAAPPLASLPMFCSVGRETGLFCSLASMFAAYQKVGVDQPYRLAGARPMTRAS